MLKRPCPVLDTIFAFPPNRDTLGGTSYLIVENGVIEEGDHPQTLRTAPDSCPSSPLHSSTSPLNILIDCPAWTETNQQFLQERGGVSILFITHRGGIGKAGDIQAAMGCKILVQEQEAYLLPGLEVIAFQQTFTLSPRCHAIWTPGYSPGSACLYYNFAGGVLFSGRHLIPNPQGELIALRTSKTFHWRRQIQSIQSLIHQFTPETLRYICPGANIGFLRGKGVMDQAYQQVYDLV